MKSKIHYPDPDSLIRTLEHPKAVRHNNGQSWAKHTDGTIYKVVAQTNGIWRIMYEVNRGQDNYRFVHELFDFAEEV